MNYCNECGANTRQAIPDGDNRPRHICSSCDTIHYQNPKVIAGVLPIWGDQVLLCRRDIEPRRGFWTLPAGFLENGESSVEGAIRECYEESLAVVENCRLLGVFDIPYIDQVYILYRGELTAPQFAPTPESSEVALFNQAEVPWGELAFPVVEMALDLHFQQSEQPQPASHHLVTRPWRPQAR
ncbi:NUDIX hydrolase [Gammaproteobacteria bacterium LSUCC0057]|jgi:ADP-ribose pyrophosphatase YjhB (NUDIX family)|uniref:NUDIX hydrolase n=1 Tax=Gammaproteobacteria bacterium LSUCC0057 TaxID=2559237 RepID=A0A4Y8UM83_9GAMM|nr:NUDIX hydrolase [Gammaproteobacteria bacterium LSUCC0057]